MPTPGETLQLSAEIVTAAKELFASYRGLDRYTIEQHECDTVRLTFRDAEAAHKGRLLLLQLATETECGLISDEASFPIPFRLMLAEPVVSLCRTIASINTGFLGTLPVDEEVSRAMRIHRQLLMDSGLTGFSLPNDEEIPSPFIADIQEALETHIERLRTFLDARGAAGGTASETADTRPESEQPALAACRAVVSPDFNVEVNGQLVQKPILKCALLALAFFEKEEPGTVRVNTGRYARLVRGLLQTRQSPGSGEENARRIWNSDITALEAAFPGMVHWGRGGEHVVNGLTIDSDSVTQQQIKDYFEHHPRRQNKKRAKPS